MRRYLIGAALAFVVTATAGFAIYGPSSSPPAKMVPLKLSDLTLDRAIRYEVTAGVSSVSPLPIPFPPTVGVVITRIESDQYTYNVPQVFYSINGGPHHSVKSGFFVVPNGAPTTALYIDGELDPPLVVRPGDILNLSCSQPNGTPAQLVLCGYFVLPGEV